MSKQQAFQAPGLVDDVHEEINDAVEELQRARGDQKRANERVARAQSTLTQRCLSLKVARYGGKLANHMRFKIDLGLPDPVAHVKFLGVDDDE